jgi:hypothetical protein
VCNVNACTVLLSLWSGLQIHDLCLCLTLVCELTFRNLFASLTKNAMNLEDVWIREDLGPGRWATVCADNIGTTGSYSLCFKI